MNMSRTSSNGRRGMAYGPNGELNLYIKDPYTGEWDEWFLDVAPSTVEVWLADQENIECPVKPDCPAPSPERTSRDGRFKTIEVDGHFELYEWAAEDNDYVLIRPDADKAVAESWLAIKRTR